MIKTLWLAYKQYRQVRQFLVQAEAANFWNDEDRMIMLRFMTSHTGQKLKARLNNMIYKAMMQACTAQSNGEYTGEYTRGLARGVCVTVQALDQHLPVVQDKDFSESHAANRDASELDHLPTR